MTDRDQEQESAGAETWETAHARRMRSLVRTAPLHAIEAAKGLVRQHDVARQDLRSLALRALDATIEHMGLGSGPTIEELLDEFAPLVRACDPALSVEAARDIGAHVLDGLLNERERRRGFSVPYTTFEQGQPRTRNPVFHLLKEVELPTGRIVVRATPEAINVYAGMLEHDIEDEQAAEEAVLRNQIRRGKIAQAVATAKQARLRSIEYEERLTAFLETARRDATQIDWVREVLHTLDEAIAHLSERLDVEREIMTAIEERLDRLAGEPEGVQLAELRRTLHDCRERHLRLHEHLITANRNYLAEQERQVFRPRPLAAIPDLEASVLRIALGLPDTVVHDMGDELLRTLQGPRPPRALNLASLVDALLAPPRQSREVYDLSPAELQPLTLRERRFSLEETTAIQEFVGASGPEPVLLSQLIARARERGLSTQLLVLTVLLAFDITEPEALAVGIDVVPAHRPLIDPEFHGDELWVTRRPEGAAS